MSNEKVEVVIEDGLIVVPQSSVPEIFSSVQAIETIVEMVRQEVSGHVPDLGTVKGRKAIASLSAKVSKSKVLLDGLGKDLVSDIKQQAKVIDAARKTARDSLDELRDETRKPLTEWEEEQDRLALQQQKELEEEQERLAAEKKLQEDHESALVENENFDLRKQLADQAEKQKIIDAENQLKNDHEAALIENENFDLLKEQAEKQAIEDAEKRYQEDHESALIENENFELRKESELKQIQHDHETALLENENFNLRKAREEEERIEREEQEEQDRLDEIEAERVAAEEKKAKNTKHQANINNAAVKDIIKAMSDVDTGNLSNANNVAKAIVSAIARGQISNVVISY